MPRKRDPRREEAKAIWLNSVGKLKLVDLAEQMSTTPSTIRKWKAQDKWDDELKGSAPNQKKSAPKKSRGHPGGQEGNQNAKGHGAPPANQNATKFGFFSKYLPPESLEIMQDIRNEEPVDLIWDQIMIQYAAIIRAQRIMFVTDKEEMIKEFKKGEVEYVPDKEKGVKAIPVSAEFDFQFAWDRQANFLNAQSRAMGELRALIKQFVAIADENDERKLKLELMRKQIAKLEGSDGEGNDEWIAALSAVANKRKHVGDHHE